MATLLEVQNLKKYFNTKNGVLHAVDDVSFQIEEGETLGIVGESGCGKSTLGKTIIQLHSSTDGKIFFQGQDVTHASSDRLAKLRNEMQLIFQDPFSSLNPRLSITQSIAEPLQNAKFSSAQIQKRVSELMDTVGLAKRLANSYPHELDGGRRQRVGIARALAINPKFIVCDEPVSALDVSIQAQIINLMLDLQDQLSLTYIFITHDLSVVRYISDNILVMYLGQMVEKCGAEELFESPRHPYTKALLSAVPEIDIDNPKRRIILQGEIGSPINPKPGCRFASRCVYAKDDCHRVDPKLTDTGGGHMVACHYVNEINQTPQSSEQ